MTRDSGLLSSPETSAQVATVFRRTHEVQRQKTVTGGAPPRKGPE